jgi:hypothetical protein
VLTVIVTISKPKQNFLIFSIFLFVVFFSEYKELIEDSRKSLYPSFSRFIFILIGVGVSSKACKLPALADISMEEILQI